MSRLIIFGDSFASLGTDKDTWQWILSEYMSCSETISYGKGGSSLTFSLDKFWEYYSNDYDKDDCIVFFATQSLRLWYLHSEAKHWWASSHLDAKKGTEEYNHFKEYNKEYDFISTHIMSAERSRMMYFLIKNTLENLPNKTILVQCFPDVYEPEGSFNLFDPSVAEINTTDKNLLFKFHSNDYRLNHFSIENHSVLAKKLYENMVYNKPMDCTDFIKNIIDI